MATKEIREKIKLYNVKVTYIQNVEGTQRSYSQK